MVYCTASADADFWDAQWENRLSPRAYDKALKGDLGPFSFLLKHIPADGKILEAGCGLAKTTVALRARGYDCEGVDFAPDTIRSVRELFPDLPVRQGDCLALNVPDDYYSAYLSFGVIEHREEGPEPFLVEAHRVLRPGGIAFFSVPHCHILRRLKGLLCLYPPVSQREFYQYAFCPRELKGLLKSHGFRTIAVKGYASWKGLKDEIPLLQKIYRLPKIGGAYATLTRILPGCDRFFGHMIGIVCKKTA